MEGGGPHLLDGIHHHLLDVLAEARLRLTSLRPTRASRWAPVGLTSPTMSRPIPSFRFSIARFADLWPPRKVECYEV